jgi:hypothetical protein
VLHRRAFEVPRRSGAAPAELAHHALAGGLRVEAFGYSTSADGGAAEVFDPRDATAHHERARGVPDAGRRLEGGAGSLKWDIEALHAQSSGPGPARWPTTGTRPARPRVACVPDRGRPYKGLAIHRHKMQ